LEELFVIAELYDVSLSGAFVPADRGDVGFLDISVAAEAGDITDRVAAASLVF
jgi:hypothetical protein